MLALHLNRVLPNEVDIRQGRPDKDPNVGFLWHGRVPGLVVDKNETLSKWEWVADLLVWANNISCVVHPHG